MAVAGGSFSTSTSGSGSCGGGWREAAAVAVTVPVAVTVAEKVAPGRWLEAQLVTSHLLPFDDLRAAHVTLVHLPILLQKTDNPLGPRA